MDAPVTLSHIANALDTHAPAGSAMAWDNVGIQVGDPAQLTQTALVALDCTPAVIDEAEKLGATLIVTHHPLLFQKLSRVQAGAGPSGLAYRLAQRGIGLVSMHTNLDVARKGVSFALAELLGLQDVSFLHPTAEARYVLTTFVPATHLELVREAMALAGAGQIGLYTDCSFQTAGTGTFRPDDTATPFTRTAAGALEHAAEIRLEMEVPRWHLPRVVHALVQAHPYEQPAYHAVPTVHPDPNTGLGAMGVLPEPLTREAFLRHVCDKLETPALRTTAGPDTIHRVAVCGGSGSDFAGDALRAGAHAYVTADVTYHKFFDVLDAAGQPRLLYVDAGHYETERHTEKLLCTLLADLFPQVAWHRTSVRTSASEVFLYSSTP